MASSKISPEVAAFLNRHVASTSDLDLLVMLIQSPERWWDASLISHRLGVSADVARTTLDRFASLNLLDIRITDAVKYRFQPGTSALLKSTTAFAAAFRAQPAAIVEHVVRSANRGPRDFADAFRIRRNDDRT